MSTINQKELEVIEQTFETTHNFLMFYADLAQMQEEEKGVSPVEFDSSKYTSEGIVTGIIVSVKPSQRKIEVEAIVDGYHRILKLDTTYAREVRRLKNEMLETCEESKREFIESYGFLNRKPYLLNVQDSVVEKLTPLDWELYEKHYSTFGQLMNS